MRAVPNKANAVATAVAKAYAKVKVAKNDNKTESNCSLLKRANAMAKHWTRMKCTNFEEAYFYDTSL